MSSRARLRPGPWLLPVLWLAAACVASVTYSGPVHRWWEERGPVVRHDSFPADCRLCHVEGSWNELREDFEFDHLAETGVPLEGAHARAECLRCHNDRGPVELFAERGCRGCHEDVHRGELGVTCESCHGTEGWRVFDFIAEHSRTRFPLIGAHAGAACWSCHPGAQNGEFTRLDPDCVSCHADDLAAALNPSHAANGWIRGCDDCHVPTQWSGGGFSHALFPLTGDHAGLDCIQCHTGGVFAGTPSDCNSCHADDFVATTTPNHSMAGFPTTCEACHSTLAWTPSAFNHTWPLTGGHAMLDCTLCHGGGTYMGTPTDCFSCHQADYNGTSRPNHVVSGIGTSCTDCHTTNAWSPATFVHSSFPLTGAHVPLNCTQCHVGGVYAGTPTSCVGCHQADYNTTSMPNHIVSGIGTACNDCHTTSAWSPATFDHSTFPLTGAHVPLNCTQCHVGGVYAGTPTSCVGCHLANYNATSMPSHSASGFNTSCDDCHTTNAWTPATFDHSFPTTGDHNLSCIDCHTTNNPPVFSCVDCHAHQFNDMLDKHDEVGGYVYSSPACLNCHPDGQDD